MRNIFTVLFMVMAFGFGCGISDEGVDASCSSDAAQTDNAVQTDVSCVPHDCELENPVGFQCVEGTFFNEKKCMCVVVLKQGCVACKPGTDNDDACDKLGYTGECDENGECIRECVLKENGSACRDMDHQCWNGECQKKCYDDTDCPDKCRQYCGENYRCFDRNPDVPKCEADEYCNPNTGDCLSCDDKDPCTTDVYNYAKQKCENSPRTCDESMYFCRVNAERSNDAICEADLCDNDDECDDHDPCTEDACWNHSEGVNYCGHQPHCLDHACVAEDGKPVCRNDQYCTGWWDCDDHDPCTSDYCLPWTGFCYFVRKSCGPKGTCVVEVGQAVCDFDE